jgi:hypothetical protein
VLLAPQLKPCTGPMARAVHHGTPVTRRTRVPSGSVAQAEITVRAAPAGLAGSPFRFAQERQCHAPAEHGRPQRTQRQTRRSDARRFFGFAGMGIKAPSSNKHRPRTVRAGEAFQSSYPANKPRNLPWSSAPVAATLHLSLGDIPNSDINLMLSRAH